MRALDKVHRFVDKNISKVKRIAFKAMCLGVVGMFLSYPNKNITPISSATLIDNESPKGDTCPCQSRHLTELK